VAISPQVPDSAAASQRQHDLDFLVLSDVGNLVAKNFGIVYRQAENVNQAFEGRLDLSAYNADESWELPLPATYVVDSDGVVRYAFLDADYKKRAEPNVILGVLRDMK
jgi:peroxiredoxin